METKQMTTEQMEQFIAENINIVPANQRMRFKNLTLEKKVSKIEFYLSMKKMWADAAEKNKLVNKVTELMVKRNATIQDATEIIEACKKFISDSRKSEIIRIGEEIARLEEMRQQLTRQSRTRSNVHSLSGRQTPYMSQNLLSWSIGNAGIGMTKAIWYVVSYMPTIITRFVSGAWTT